MGFLGFQMLGFVEKVRLEASDEFSEAAALERAVQACDMFVSEQIEMNGSKLENNQRSSLLGVRSDFSQISRYRGKAQGVTMWTNSRHSSKPSR